MLFTMHLAVNQILDKLVPLEEFGVCKEGLGPLYFTLSGFPITVLGRNLPSPSSTSHLEG